MTEGKSQPNALRWLVGLAAFVIIVAGMRTASSIIVPFLLALFVAIIASPVVVWMQQKRVPMAITLLLLVAALAGLGIGLAAVVGSSFEGFSEQLPAYQEALQQKTDEFTAWLEGKGIKTPDRLSHESLNPNAAMGFVGTLLGSLSSLVSNSFLILITVVFLLVEASSLEQKLGNLPGAEGTSRFRQIIGSVRQYMALKTVVSFATGVLVAIWVAIVGVEYAMLWGLIAFLLNYVPNIGSIIAAVPAVLVALIQKDGGGIGPAIWTGAGFLAVNTVIGNLVEPRLMGRGLDLSTLVVFLSLVFWGWVLGPVGMLLSVPLTMATKIVLESGDDTRWLAVLLGGSPAADKTG